MDVISIIATARGMMEEDLVERITYRQLAHIAQSYFVDKMFVVRSLLDGFKQGHDDSSSAVKISQTGKKRTRVLDMRKATKEQAEAFFKGMPTKK